MRDIAAQKPRSDYKASAARKEVKKIRKAEHRLMRGYMERDFFQKDGSIATRLLVSVCSVPNVRQISISENCRLALGLLGILLRFDACCDYAGGTGFNSHKFVISNKVLAGAQEE